MATWGIISAVTPARAFQSPGCSQELLPIGDPSDPDGDQPCVLSDCIIERMIAGGATKLCFVLSPAKADIMEYFGGGIGDVDIVYVVQPKPAGACGALFRAAALVAPDEGVLFARGDGIWFPADGFSVMPDRGLSFLLFPAKQSDRFETVVTDNAGELLEIEAPSLDRRASCMWGAAKMDGTTFRRLQTLWLQRDRRDESVGALVNAYLATGGQAAAVQAGMTYLDGSTLEGYHGALRVLHGRDVDLPPNALSRPPEPIGYHDGWRPLTARNYAAAFPQQRIQPDGLHRSSR